MVVGIKTKKKDMVCLIVKMGHDMRELFWTMFLTEKAPYIFLMVKHLEEIGKKEFLLKIPNNRSKKAIIKNRWIHNS